MLTDSLIDTFRAKLDEVGLELADLRIGGTPNRPLVQVRIEWPVSDPARNVSVDDCSRASRALESWLDGDGRFGSRYVLEVSSPGLDRALRWPRHWARFVGHDVNATVAGLGRVRARIVAVPDEATVVLQPLVAAGRPGGAPRSVRLSEVRDARLAVDW